MSEEAQSNQNSKIIYTGVYYDIGILAISKKRFEDYKKFGLPSTGAGAENWDEHMEAEELLEELAGESIGSMVYSEEHELNYLTKAGVIESLRLKYEGALNIAIYDTRSATAIKNGNYDDVPLKPGGDGKYYLIQKVVANNAQYDFTINEEFEVDKLAIKIAPEALPGGTIVNCLIMEYDGKFFNYNYETHKFSKPEFYLVDSKGSLFLTKMNDEPSAKIQKILSKNENLTEWFPADVNPARVGEYEVELLEGAVWPMPAYIDAEWNGKTWKNYLGKLIKIKQWRGLNTQT